MANWKFVSITEIDKEFKINGLNIWNHYWHCTDRNVEIVDPFEGQTYFFKEYEIRTPEKTITFVAGEFSDGQIGIYKKENIAI